MHHQPTGPDQTTTLDSYEWPTCAAGPATGTHSHHLWDNELDRLVCWPCEEKTAVRLAELPALFQQLNTTAMLMKGARGSSGPTSGTRTAPIPPRGDVLSLVGPGGIATRLQAIEDAWRKAFGRPIKPATDGVRVFAWGRTNPARAVPGHVEFLAINLRRACETYESIGQDINDLRRLHGECKALIEHKPRTGQVKIGLCPALIEGRRCAEQLYAGTRSFKTACETCGNAWEGEDEWRELRAAQQQAQTELACVAA